MFAPSELLTPFQVRVLLYLSVDCMLDQEALTINTDTVQINASKISFYKGPIASKIPYQHSK